MTSITHSLVAVAIGVKIQNPAIAFPLCFLSNYLLDMIPHWDFGYGWRKKSKVKLFLEGFIDITVSYSLVLISHNFFFNTTSLSYLLLCAFIAQLPDWLELPYLLLNLKQKPFYFFYKIQHLIHRKLDLPWGILPQVGLVIPFLFWATT